MANQGQIVEIPSTSPLYSREAPEFLTKKEFLIWESQIIKYSLFDGFLVGEHYGVENFRLGQRKGIKVGGKKQPLYVIQVDQENNRLFVGAGENHPALWTKVLSFEANFFHWNQEQQFTNDELARGIPIEISSSVLDEKIPATLYIFENTVFLEFQKPNLMIIKENPIDLFYQNIIVANTIK